MSLRTLDELKAAAADAMKIGDINELLCCAQELADLGHRNEVANVSSNIGLIYWYGGNYPAALEHYLEALGIHEELGNRLGVARVTNNIGAVYADIGDHHTALEHYRQVLSLYEELGDLRRAAGVTGNIGTVLADIGKHSEALEYYHKALTSHQELGDHRGVARDTVNIIQALIAVGDFSEAESMMQTMQSMHIEEPIVLIDRETAYAAIQIHRGELDAAAKTLHATLKIADQHSLPATQSDIHKRLRDLCQKTNDFAGYIEHNNEFLRIAEEINGKETASKLATQEAERRIATERQQRDKERAVLYSTLPKHVADRVVRGEQVTDHFDDASVLFLDIVGFTKISDRIPAGHVVHLLKAIFKVCDEACTHHGLTRVKTIGDSYFAVCGVPEPLTDHVDRTARAAMEMLERLDALVLTMDPTLGDPSWVKDVGEVKVRIGLHRGPVVAGIVGDDRLQYDVWGDTVNLASRLEGASEPGRIQVSEAFALALGQGQLRRDVEDRDVEEGNVEDRDVEDGTSKSEGVPRSPFPVPRGEIDIKGKGLMRTYWLEQSR